MKLDEKYYACRKREQEENAEVIQRADAKFKLDARIAQGKGPKKRFVPLSTKNKVN